MARKSRKNTPIAVAEPTDNLTTKAVLSLDKQAKLLKDRNLTE